MPTADQIKALLSSHAEGDEGQFFSVAMQIAAAEARQGHDKLAKELRALIDKGKGHVASVSTAPVPLARPRGELADILAALGLSYADVARATEDAIKTALIEGRVEISTADVMAGIRDRKATLSGNREAD